MGVEQTKTERPSFDADDPQETILILFSQIPNLRSPDVGEPGGLLEQFRRDAGGAAEAGRVVVEGTGFGLSHSGREPTSYALERRHVAGAAPNADLNARENAASDS